MARTVEKKRIVGNPGKRRASRSRNPGDILGFQLAAGNPGRKVGSMATRTKKKSSGRGYAKAKKSTGGRRNPGRRPGSTKKTHRRRPRNPGMVAGIGPMVTNAVFVIVGALGSKLGAQAVLGTNNVGLVGYAGNAAAGGVLWFLTEKVMRNRAASNGVIAGTIVQIVLRMINDYTPFGSYVAQLGMGDYQMQSFVTPQVLVDPYNSAQISIPSGWAPKVLPPAAQANGVAPAMAANGGEGMSGLYTNTNGGLY